MTDRLQQLMEAAKKAVHVLRALPLLPADQEDACDAACNALQAAIKHAGPLPPGLELARLAERVAKAGKELELRAAGAPYAWVIMCDHTIDPGKLDANEMDSTGMIGPAGTRLSREQIKSHPNRLHFRMKDDDGIVNLDGYLVDISGDCTMFEPLEDFGRGSYGCVSIEYAIIKDGEQVWEGL